MPNVPNRSFRMETVYVYYTGNNFDKAIKAERRRRLLRGQEVKIIALPESWKTKEESKENEKRASHRII